MNGFTVNHLKFRFEFCELKKKIILIVYVEITLYREACRIPL